MKPSSVVVSLICVLAVILLLWLAGEGYSVVRWRLRYWGPAFLTGLVVGILGTAAVMGGRR